MKKIIIGVALMIPLISFGQTTQGPGNIGSLRAVAVTPHNFSGAAWNILSGETVGAICRPCHTPHNSKGYPTPLWNHEMATTSGWSMYTKWNGTTALEGLSAPSGASLLCLSCHDGTIALNAFGGQTPGATMIGANSNLTKDLTNDHPIGVTKGCATTKVTSSYSAPGVYVENTTRTKMLSSWLEGYTTTSATNGVGEVQCTSCHSPHSNTYGYQLLNDNTASGLCLNCHW